MWSNLGTELLRRPLPAAYKPSLNFQSGSENIDIARETGVQGKTREGAARREGGAKSWRKSWQRKQGNERRQEREAASAIAKGINIGGG